MAYNPLTNSDLYQPRWCNIYGQVLEIRRDLPAVPGEHRQLLPKYFLTETEYLDRGFLIQRYIDLGWITKESYVPLLPPGYLWMQSANGTWWRYYATLTKGVPGLTAVAAPGPPDPSALAGSNIMMDYGNFLSVQLNAHQAVSLSFVEGGGPGGTDVLVYQLRATVDYPVHPTPLAIPYTLNLLCRDSGGNPYSIYPDNSGTLGPSDLSTFAYLTSDTSLMMLSLEAAFGTVPQMPGQWNYNFAYNASASTSPQAGSFQGTFIYQAETGALFFPFPAVELAALSPGTYKLSGGSAVTVNGILTVN